MREVEVAVVGAGPAGAAAALAALRADGGARVALLDRSGFPRDKVCGDGIGPDGLDVLAELGIAGLLADVARQGRVRVTTPGGARAEGPVPRAGVVLPRHDLDARLRRAAVDAGAVPLTRRVRDVVVDRDTLVLDGVLRARTVIAADGAHSAVRRALGIRANRRSATGLAMRAYAPDPGLDALAIDFVGERWPAYAWAFPTGTGTVNVGYGPFDATTVARRGDLVDTLARRAAAFGLEPDPDTLRAAHLPLSTDRPPPARGRVLLVGDAASLVHPLTGEGIYAGLRSGALAGTAAIEHRSDPGAAYTRALRRRLGGHLRDTSLAARAFRLRTPTDVAVAAAGRDPEVLAQLCAFALGEGRLTPRTVASMTRALTLRGAGRVRRALTRPRHRP